MNATEVTYNGVNIHNCHLAGVEQNILYDRSRTDQIAVETRLVIRGTVFQGRVVDHSRPNVRMSHIVTDPSQLAAFLSVPRAPLRVEKVSSGADGGEDRRILWNVRPASDRDYPPQADQDCAGGPKPEGVLVTNTHRWGWDIEFRVAFTLQTRSPDGAHRAGNAPIDYALNNRWQSQETFDPDFFCTKTYTGSIRLSQPIPTVQALARLLAFPMLEPGFRREAAEYTVSEDGLEVSYRITDRQVDHAAPWPCTRMDVSHSESLQQFGYLVHSSCVVQLWGPPGVPKVVLLARLSQILQNRVAWDGLMGNASFVQSLRITDHIGEANTVSGELTVARFPSGQTEPDNPDVTERLLGVLGTDIRLDDVSGPAATAAEEVLGPPYSDPLQSPTPSPFGYDGAGKVREPAAIAFYACYYQVPEHPPHHFHPAYDAPALEPHSSADSAAAGYPPPTRSRTAIPPTASDPLLAESHAAAVYTYAAVQNDYDSDLGRCVLSKTRTAEDGDDEGDDVEIIEIARPRSRRRMIYEAERVGEWPEIPAPQDYDIPHGGAARLLRRRIQPQPPVLGADGKRMIYRIRAEYEWALSRAADADLADAGSLPYIRPETIAELNVAAMINPGLTLASAGLRQGLEDDGTMWA